MLLSDVYKISSTENVLELEKTLSKKLKDLTAEIEENELVHGIPPKPFSTVPIPKDIKCIQQKRKDIINRAMKVSDAQPLIVQADTMQEEMMMSQSLEYTPESLPLLLQQFFLDRIHQLVQCKHQYLLRWKRFCEHTKTMENLYPVYQKRLGHILREYDDCIQRAQRLSIAQESYYLRNDASISAVHLEDLFIYLRWLVCHLHSVKKFNQFVRVLQWFPVKHQNNISLHGRKKVEYYTGETRLSLRYDAPLLSLDDTWVDVNKSRKIYSLGEMFESPQHLTHQNVLSSNHMLSLSKWLAAATAGVGGLASDEINHRIPLITTKLEHLKNHLKFFLKLYNINCDVEKVKTCADEMNMYGSVFKKFKEVFQQQEIMKTFKAYDLADALQENWGSSVSPKTALKKPSNWQSFITLKPEKDTYQEKNWTELRHENKIDELLNMKSHFLHISDLKKVIEVLHDHAEVVKEAPAVHASSKSFPNYNALWAKIYSHPRLYLARETTGDSEDIQDTDEEDLENLTFTSRSRVSSARKNQGYDYINTVQMLGLDTDESGYEDTAGVLGGYMSFLYLRHIYLRDLQRTSLSILNYFRSVERTLTINDGGLSFVDGDLKQTSVQDHKSFTDSDGSVGGSGGLDCHGYLHNSPVDFKISEVEFIKFSNIENHDDFYTEDEGRMHVQDQKGYYIMYDAAIEDLQVLEHDLLLLGSHYLQKDKNYGNHTYPNSSDSVRRHQKDVASDFDVSSYAHKNADRFGILLDLWINYSAFLDCKMELIKCYMEAYQHVFDRDERRLMAHTVMNLIYQKPRLDFAANYIGAFLDDTICLRLQATLVKHILNKQIDDQRIFCWKVCRDDKSENEYGLPFKIVDRQLISVHTSKSELKSVYMLEFHPSLAIASRIPLLIKNVVQELLHIHKSKHVGDNLLIEKKVLELAIKEWKSMKTVGYSFSKQMQKDIFTGVVIEDPLLVCNMTEKLLREKEETARTLSQKERNLNMLMVVAKIMELLTLRYRLIDAAWETEILSGLYRTQAMYLGFEDYHLYTRCVQFEFSKYNGNAGKRYTDFITAMEEDDLTIDRYVPSGLLLAAQELDDTHIGRLSFHSKESIIQLLSISGLKNLQVVLMCQLAHRNILMASVQLVYYCHVTSEIQREQSSEVSSTESNSEKYSLTQLRTTDFSQNTLDKKFSEGKTEKILEAFVSIQVEKVPFRDLMLNEFVQKRQSMGVVLKSLQEMEKLKRELITDFCSCFHDCVAEHSFRSQIIAYYISISRLLDDFPIIRNKYFMKGEVRERKTYVDGPESLVPDPGTLRSRPEQLLSTDGTHVLNIWFIPHCTEILMMFKDISSTLCLKALRYCLEICSALHDILHYVCAHAKLGTRYGLVGSRKSTFITAGWGGEEGIGVELLNIQKEIDSLADSMNPEFVSTLLKLHRDTMFLEFDAAVRHSVKETFLLTGNLQGYQAVSNNMGHGLRALSNVPKPSVFSFSLGVPDLLEESQAILPWRSFNRRNGHFPQKFWPWHCIENNIQLCLCELNEVDRHVANGEISGITLLMEDVIHGENSTGHSPCVLRLFNSALPDGASSLENTSEQSPDDASSLENTSEQPAIKKLDVIKEYKLMKAFLFLWKRLEIMKNNWGERRIGKKLNEPEVYKEFCRLYRSEIAFPVVQSIARKVGLGQLYDGLIMDTGFLVVPKGVSEIEVRAKQLAKLLEKLELHMINNVLLQFNKELTLVISERLQDEAILPTDLWKKPVMSAHLTIKKPQIMEHFQNKLMSKYLEQTADTVTFSQKHLNDCLFSLAQSVMEREKYSSESYVIYFENLLRTHHHQLYQREQEIRNLKEQARVLKGTISAEVQCQMADKVYDILLEIIALRAKIREMSETSLTQEQHIRTHIREEYYELIQNFFHATSHLKLKFDEFRNDLHDDVYEKIVETRREAVEAMEKLKQRVFGTSETEKLRKSQSSSESIRELQSENHDLQALLLKMRALNRWHFNHSNSNYRREIEKLQKKLEKSNKDCIKSRMIAKEQVVILRQEMVALRKELIVLDKECIEIKRQLDAELKVKMEKQHEERQLALNLQQLNEVKQENIDKLLDELEEKQLQLGFMAEEQERSSRLQYLAYEKANKDVSIIKKQLSNERKLKLSAFQRVDELQNKAENLSGFGLGQSHSAMRMSSAPSSRTKSRIASATTRQSRPGSRSSQFTGGWPKTGFFVTNQSLTPEPSGCFSGNNIQAVHVIQRPKTVSGQLRSKVINQLLSELNQEDNQTIVKLP